jgi:hypothetical protein
MATKAETERVIFIEYDDGRPFGVVTLRGEGGCREYYNLEYCNRDKQIYFHDSGGGGYTSPIEVSAGTKFWAAPDAPVEAQEGAIRLKRAVGRRKFEEALAGGWVKGISEGETVYCRDCDDFLPTGDTNAPCDHVWWCDWLSDWSRPDERCPWDCPDCLARGREVQMPAAPILIAQGYGLAASPLATLARRLLSRHGLTPETLGERMRCDDWAAAARMALRDEIHPEANFYDLGRLAGELKLGEAERDELFEVFGFAERSDER